jgi:hypothetical protein
MTDLDQLTARLRRWTATQDNHRRAAVELLIWHEYWLRRPDFMEACVRTHPENEAVSYIKFGKAREFAILGPQCSTSAFTVLNLAITLGLDELRLLGLGTAHRHAAAQAFAAALGVTSLDTRETGTTVPDLSVRELSGGEKVEQAVHHLLGLPENF